MKFRRRLKNVEAKKLVDGYVNKITGKNENLAKERAKFCAVCPENVDEPIKELSVGDSIEKISKKMCNSCGCSLPIKVRSKKSKCPLGKW